MTDADRLIQNHQNLVYHLLGTCNRVRCRRWVDGVPRYKRSEMRLQEPIGLRILSLPSNDKRRGRKGLRSMLRKIENGDVMTVEQLRQHYADNWFRYVIVTDAPRGRPTYEAMARVIFLADSKDELLSIPRDQRYEPNHQSGGNDWGWNINPEQGIQIGGIEVEWIHFAN